MKKILTALTSVALVLGLSGCGANDTSAPSTSSSERITTTTTTTTSEGTTTPTSSVTSAVSSKGTTQPAAEEPVLEQAYTAPSSVVEETYVAPAIPPFRDPEDYDPYGPPTFVQCWEPNAAVMSDGSIVTDTVNCPNTDPAWGIPPVSAEDYGEPPRSDGCVGPAAVCGYYDEYGNPIWFDKMTGETSPRYYDEYGNPTMEAY